MAYTASALSFMLEDLGKTVVGFICLVDRPSLPVQRSDLDRRANTTFGTPERCNR